MVSELSTRDRVLITRLIDGIVLELFEFESSRWWLTYMRWITMCETARLRLISGESRKREKKQDNYLTKHAHY